MTCRDEHIIRIIDIQTKRYGDSDYDVSSRSCRSTSFQPMKIRDVHLGSFTQALEGETHLYSLALEQISEVCHI